MSEAKKHKNQFQRDEKLHFGPSNRLIENKYNRRTGSIQYNPKDNNFSI